jgi:hypothetical protein
MGSTRRFVLAGEIPRMFAPKTAFVSDDIKSSWTVRAYSDSPPTGIPARKTSFPSAGLVEIRVYREVPSREVNNPGISIGTGWFPVGIVEILERNDEAP